MCFSRLLFFCCFILVHAVTPTVAQHVCSGVTTPVTVPTGKPQKPHGLHVFQHPIIDYGFYNYSAGENPDKVNAIALCRGDISTDKCRSCVNSTSYDLLHKECPNQNEAVRWPDECIVRYSNRDIFGVMEPQPAFTVYADQNASDVEGFNQVLRSLLDRLRNRAASGNSTRKFAAGSCGCPELPNNICTCAVHSGFGRVECNNCCWRLWDIFLVEWWREVWDTQL
ncbi:hypothetical protein SLA2020_378340 [Shorea laevis]